MPMLTRSMPKLSVLAAVVTALLLGLAACGGSSKSSSSAAAPATSSSAGTGTGANTTTSAAAGGGGEQSIAADPSGKLAYTKKSLTAKAGTVKIAFTNKAPLAHNLTIQKGSNGAVVGATPT